MFDRTPTISLRETGQLTSDSFSASAAKLTGAKARSKARETTLNIFEVCVFVSKGSEKREVVEAVRDEVFEIMCFVVAG